MRKCYFVIFIVSSFLLRAQGFKVRHYIPNALTNSSKAIFEESPGNYIAAGITLDTINGEQVNHLTIMGLGANGQLLWHKKYGSTKWMYLDNSFITRSFYKQGNFLYHACCVQDSNGKYNGVLLKFNFNGDTLWQKIYRDSLGLIPQMVTGSVDGGFLITGYFFSGNPGLLIKTDANGNELWRKKFGPVVQDGKAILQDSASKKVVIAGYQLFGNNGITDNFLILDSIGNILAQPNYLSVGGVINDMIQTKDKKIVAVGYQYSPQTVGGNNLMRSYIVKFDLDSPFVPIWEIDSYDKLVLNNSFSCLKELENGDVVVGGLIDTMQLKNLPPNSVARLIKIDENGDVKWSRYYDYKTTDSASFNYLAMSSLDLTSDNGLVAAFKFLNIPNPNPFFFVKFDDSGCDSSAAHCATLNLVGVKEVKSKDVQVGIYPNPTQNGVTINYGSSTQSKVKIELTDVLGRLIYTNFIYEPVSNHYIPMSHLNSGMYLITLSRGNENIYKGKIIKED